MEDRLHLSVVSPAGVLLNRQVSYVQLPVVGGSLGVLAGHAHMLCALQQGSIRYRQGSHPMETLEIPSGVAEVKDNQVTLLVR